jgi:hypothetical protein
MPITILLIALALIVVAALPVAGFISYVKSKDRKKGPLPAIGDDYVESSKTRTCARCGEKRIIVNEDDTLCASCYSALRTKKLG